MANPPKAKPKISIHSPQTEPERERVYSFRYRTQIDRNGGSSIYADHDSKMIKDELDDSAFHLFLMANGSIVAAVRVNSASTSPFSKQDVARFQFEKFAEYGRNALSMTSRLVMVGSPQQSQMAAVLLGAAYKIVRNNGSRFDFAACPPSMVGMYEVLGYRRFGPNFEDEDGVYNVPLCLVTEDEQYLRDTRSPFGRLAGEFLNTADTSQWFDRAFPEFAGSFGDHTMDEDKFWEHLTEKLQQTPLERIPLLKGLEYADARQFLRAGTTLRCKEGDQIV